MPARLQCLDVPILEEEKCEMAYPGMLTRRMVCAGYMDGGRDVCNIRTVYVTFLMSPFAIFVVQSFRKHSGTY